jgi:hypothetical protein
MAAANTDKLKKLSRKWVGQIGSGGVSDAVVTTIPLASTTNLPTDTAVVLVIDRVDSAGTKTPAKEETIIGVVSGTNIVNAVRGSEGTAQAHDAGAVVEVLVTAKGYNDIIDHLLVSHLQDGRISGSAVTASNISASAVTPGAISFFQLSTNTTLSENSDTLVPSQKATKAYVDNKVYQPRVISASSYTTNTGTSLSADDCDVFQITAQAGDLLFNAPGGTPVAGQKLIIRIKDNGTARALTYNAIYRASSDLALPTTTVLSKTLYMGFMYNATDTKWDLLAVLNNI